ncbi:hypothetical protein CK203_059243 [Vitis vinifera]|uniref:Reverse transcriptase domain-containing protein n=1 Tax=Vitis vinifera TaxID=29760 RepID=A0A438GEA7_VITVI|nr:hypothetical protein CK203_059243 [Vitis vinifera]
MGSPTQVVPKKSGITVVQNDKGEEVSNASLQAIHSTVSWMATLVFMDDITVYGSAFDECLVNLEAVLNRCIEKDLVLNWENAISWYPRDRLGHIISSQGIEVDKAKVELIVKLPSPTISKECKSKADQMDSLASRIQSSDQRQERSEECVADHLSRLAIAHNSHSLPINDDFPEESLMLIEVAPWYAHIANYLVTREVPSEWKAQDKKHFFAKIHAYYWEEHSYSNIVDQIIRKCVIE